MKKLFVMGLLFLLLINLVYALECQYLTNETYQETDEYFYHNGQLIGTHLNLTELIRLEGGGRSIRITNNLRVPITLDITYKLYSNWFGVDSLGNVIKTIPPNNYEDFEATLPYIVDYKYVFAEPNIITSEIKTIDKNRTICRICPNGKQCLDDGAPCELDIACGAKICNPDKKCGVFNGCSGGKRLCNNISCLTPSIKQNGESYACEWECSSGTINCDGICRRISVKNLGQEYHCKEECISQEGDGKICIKNKEQLAQEVAAQKKGWITFSMVGIIVVAMGWWYFAFHKRKKEEDKTKETVKMKEELEKELDKLKIEKEYTKKDIRRLQKEKDEGEETIKILRIKIKNSEGEAKRKLEEALISAEEKQKERTKNITEKNKDLLIKEKELNKKGAQLDKESEEIIIKSYENYKKAQLDKYKRLYDSPGKTVDYDENSKYFKIEYKSGKEISLHKYIYSNKFGLKDNEEVHHIDTDSLNDEEWNLIALPIEKHNMNRPGHFSHSLVWKKDWGLGYNALKKYLGWRDEQFPEHIKRHLKGLRRFK